LDSQNFFLRMTAAVRNQQNSLHRQAMKTFGRDSTGNFNDTKSFPGYFETQIFHHPPGTSNF
jgi:hypothetical protein